MERITSLQNPRVKQLVRLRDRRPRDEAGVFLVEGYRQIRRALEKNIAPAELYVSPEWFLGENEPALIAQAGAAGARIFELTKDVFAKVAYRERPDGLLAVTPQWRNTLDSLDAILAAKMKTKTATKTAVAGSCGSSGTGVPPVISERAKQCARQNPGHTGETPMPPDPIPAAATRAATGAATTVATRAATRASAAPFLLVVEAIEKPGNLGTILRGADAAGADAVIVCDPVTDIFNPNVVRSSTGVLFSVPVVVAESRPVRAWLRARGIRAVATTPAATLPHCEADLRGPLAIIMGSEQYGLSDFWLAESDLRVRIPMAGQADSLNVAMAAIITLFEAVRQRR